LTTNCVLPPELDDKQLLAYLDDRTANQETSQHLEKCPYCQERAAALDRLQKHLTTRLYRATCPSPMDLGEYHLRMLPASQMLLASAHVSVCPHCRQEITQLESYLSEFDQSNVLDGVKRFVALLVGRRDPSHTFGGLRGEDEAPVRYQADDISIILGIQEDMEYPGLKMLLGLIPGLDLRGFMVEIHQGENVVTTTVVDDIGNFLFTRLTPGLYDLVIPSHGVEVRIPSVIV
jgi:hypothetical protein